MFTIVSHSKSAKIHVPLEMRCALVETYIKNYFLIQLSDFGVT